LLRGRYCLYTQEGDLWTQTESKGIWFEKFSMIISSIGFAHCHSNHKVFVRRTKSGSVILTVYIDDILLIDSDSMALTEIKEYLK